MTVRAACFDLLSALLDSWAVWDAVAAELGSPGLGRPWRRGYLAPTSVSAMRLSQVAYVAGSAFDAEGALAYGFQVTWVNRLGDAVPPSLTAVRVIGTLAGWTP